MFLLYRVNLLLHCTTTTLYYYYCCWYYYSVVVVWVCLYRWWTRALWCVIVLTMRRLKNSTTTTLYYYYYSFLTEGRRLSWPSCNCGYSELTWPSSCISFLASEMYGCIGWRVVQYTVCDITVLRRVGSWVGPQCARGSSSYFPFPLMPSAPRLLAPREASIDSTVTFLYYYYYCYWYYYSLVVVWVCL